MAGACWGRVAPRQLPTFVGRHAPRRARMWVPRRDVWQATAKRLGGWRVPRFRRSKTSYCCMPRIDLPDDEFAALVAAVRGVIAGVDTHMRRGWIRCARRWRGWKRRQMS